MAGVSKIIFQMMMIVVDLVLQNQVYCIVVTGYGKSRRVWRASDVQQAALELLKNLELEAQVLQSLGFLGILNITFNYLLDIISPIVG